ncbi:MAG: hypothetical protein WCI11_10780 [Candidatus Methylumidiphilus sp.]
MNEQPKPLQIEPVQKIKKIAEKTLPIGVAPSQDACDGHCINPDPGTMGHHDNRQPLF